MPTSASPNTQKLSTSSCAGEGRGNSAGRGGRAVLQPRGQVGRAGAAAPAAPTAPAACAVLAGAGLLKDNLQWVRYGAQLGPQALAPACRSPGRRRRGSGWAGSGTRRRAQTSSQTPPHPRGPAGAAMAGPARSAGPAGPASRRDTSQLLLCSALNGRLPPCTSRAPQLPAQPLAAASSMIAARVPAAAHATGRALKARSPQAPAQGRPAQHAERAHLVVAAVLDKVVLEHAHEDGGQEPGQQQHRDAAVDDREPVDLQRRFCGRGAAAWALAQRRGHWRSGVGIDMMSQTQGRRCAARPAGDYREELAGQGAGPPLPSAVPALRPARTKRLPSPSLPSTSSSPPPTGQTRRRACSQPKLQNHPRKEQLSIPIQKNTPAAGRAAAPPPHLQVLLEELVAPVLVHALLKGRGALLPAHRVGELGAHIPAHVLCAGGRRRQAWQKDLPQPLLRTRRHCSSQAGLLPLAIRNQAPRPLSAARASVPLQPVCLLPTNNLDHLAPALSSPARPPLPLPSAPRHPCPPALARPPAPSPGRLTRDVHDLRGVRGHVDLHHLVLVVAHVKVDVGEEVELGARRAALACAPGAPRRRCWLLILPDYQPLPRKPAGAGRWALPCPYPPHLPRLATQLHARPVQAGAGWGLQKSAGRAHP